MLLATQTRANREMETGRQTLPINGLQMGLYNKEKRMLRSQGGGRSSMDADVQSLKRLTQ